LNSRLSGIPQCEATLSTLKRHLTVLMETIYGKVSGTMVYQRLINIITCQHEDSLRRVIHGGRLTEPFTVKIGKRHGCVLSPVMFLLIINWVTRRSTDSKGTSIRWISGKNLEDLEYADDLVLLSDSFNHIQETI